MCAKDSQTWLFLKEESLPILILCDWGYLKWGHVSKECRGHATTDTLLHYMMMPWHTRIERQIQKVVKQRRETRYPIALKYVPETPASIQCGIPLSCQYRLTTRLMKTTSSQVHDLRFTWWSIWHLLHQTAVDRLGVSGPELHLKLSTVLAQETIWCIRKATYTREIIPARHSQILRPETARKWPHLKKVAHHLMPYNDQLAYYLTSTMHAPLSQGKSLLEVTTTSMQNETLLSGELINWTRKVLTLGASQYYW